MASQIRQGFWHEAFALNGAVIPRIIGRVVIFGGFAGIICGVTWFLERFYERRLSLDVTPHELAGVALGLLLVMRTNAGYDRWWEARKLWGGFVDRCRNLTISALSYGPKQQEWRKEVARWVAVYPHVARHSLRRERPSTEVEKLVGGANLELMASSDHMPSFVALKLGSLLNEARDQAGMDGFAFLQIDRERTLLIDNYGGCERILNTPLPRVFSIKIRHFITLYLLTLPLALLHRVESDWFVPFITMLVAYPLLSLDQIGVELEHPFALDSLSHLPLDDISAAIERNVFATLNLKQNEIV